MQIPIYQIDAFTHQTFRGNPAVVCLLENDDDLSDEIKQKIAAEVKQPMTAFVSRQWSGNTISNSVNNYKIRYFTATQECEICGHATVATTLVLNKITKQLTKDDIINENNEKLFYFETKFGETLTTRINDKELITISMPINETESIVSLDDQWVQNVIKYSFGPQLDSSFVEEVSKTRDFVLIKLKDYNENYITKLEPDFGLLRTLEHRGIKSGIIVTQKANLDSEKVHFYSRMFAPWTGIGEDPVCGHAHTQLLPYWSHKLGIKGPLIGFQCSERGGIIRCVRNKDRVELTGSAVLVFSGTVLL